MANTVFGHLRFFDAPQDPENLSFAQYFLFRLRSVLSRKMFFSIFVQQMAGNFVQFAT